MSAHFSKDELSCPCCGILNIDEHLVNVLEQVREGYNNPMYITSGCRCPDKNRAVGGAEKSYHITTDNQKGKAVDIYLPYDPALIVKLLMLILPRFKRIGIYRTHLHVDIGEGSAVWFS